MTRDGFMKELAYLLQDIQDEDKEDDESKDVILEHGFVKRQSTR